MLLQGCHKSGKPGKMSVFDQNQGKPGKVRGKVWKSGKSHGKCLKMVVCLQVFW